MIYPFTARAAGEERKMRERGKSLNFILFYDRVLRGCGDNHNRTGMAGELAQLRLDAASRRTPGHRSPSSAGSSSGCDRDHLQETGLQTFCEPFSRCWLNWLGWVSRFSPPTTRCHSGQVIKKPRVLLITHSSDAPRRISASLRSLLLRHCLPDKKLLICAGKESGVARNVVKEIPSTAPTSVCPCLSRRPARWLMQPTYVTNISIWKCADRQTDRELQLTWPLLVLKMLHTHFKSTRVSWILNKL